MKTETILRQRLKAFKYHSPLIFLVAFVMACALLFSSDVATTYLNIKKNEAAYLSLFVFTYAFPFCLFIGSMYAVIKGYYVYKSKFNPPKNIPAFINAKTKISKCPSCIFVASIVFLLFSLYLMYFGHGVFNEIYSAKNT